MEKRQIRSLDVTVVGVGCNNFGRRVDAAGTQKVIDAALDAGINFFDTADVYGSGESETLMGQFLQGRRDKVIIATKFGNEMAGQGKGAKPDYIRTAVEASLRRLKTDYIDLYQLHVPDPETPIAETLGALDELVKEGKVREIGSSNFSAEQMREAEAAVRDGGARFVSVQNEYSMVKRDDEAEVLPECKRLDIAYLPYFPLASGVLTGKYRKGEETPEGARLTGHPRADRWLNDVNMDKVEDLIAFAEGQGHSILELAFSWLLMREPVASVIAGATKPEQIYSNAKAAGWQLSTDEMAKVDAILMG